MISLEDPLDSTVFDPVEYVNSRFPTESSLGDLDNFTTKVSDEIISLDNEISKTVHSQSNSGEKARNDIEHAKKAIVELFDIVLAIKTKASQSEETVQELCADIRKLDCAKTHLQATITSLKRLQMLITAVTQLRDWRELPLKQVANMVEAVKQLITHFESYDNVEKIVEIKSTIKEIASSLCNFVTERFSEVGELTSNPNNTADLFEGNQISEICMVVDALGDDVRNEILEKFVNTQLDTYDGVFGSDSDNCTLEAVERRWPWFKRLAKTVETRFQSVIPTNWSLQRHLCLNFCKRTSQHLLLILRNSGAAHDRIEKNPSTSSNDDYLSNVDIEGDSVDVSALLKALQTTLRFEEEMSRRYDQERLESGENKDETSNGNSNSNSDSNSKNHSKSVSIISKEISNKNDDNDVNNNNNNSSSNSKADAKILGIMSHLFDNYLKPYILLERGNLDEMISRVKQEETDAMRDVMNIDSDGGGEIDDQKALVNDAGVLHSSTSMFVFVKNSIKRCTALTNGYTFYLLSKEFRTCLFKYSEWLVSKLPTATINIVTNQSVYRFTRPVTEVCYVINTCEYCAEVIPTLESMIKSKIDINYASQVDLSNETDVYLDLSGKAVRALVGGVVSMLDSGFKNMVSIPWASMTTLGEESTYVYEWQSVLANVVPDLRSTLSTIYFKNVCTKVASEIIQKFLDVIKTRKRITDMAIQQLQMDTYNLKSLLLSLHSLSSSSSSGGDHNDSTSNSSSSSAFTTPAMFARMVNSRISHIETLLKLIATPDDMLLERFRIMWSDGTSSDLQTILNLKGTRRSEQTKLLEALSKVNNS